MSSHRRESFVESFTACGWNAVALDRFEVDRMRQAMRERHPGAVLVDSCQRIETYQAEPCSCESPLKLRGPKAVRHLAEVASGVHSVVLGEEQILGQVRAACTTATGPLRTITDIAIGSARELRQREQFNSHAGALLDRALKVAGVAPQGRLLVLGTGQLGQLVARRGVELGFSTVYLAGRSPLAHAGPWEFLRIDRVALCPDVDVVAGCLGSSAGAMFAGELPHARALIADLGTPRNFAGEFAAPLICIADLLADEANRPHAMRRRSALAEQVGAIVEARLAHLAGDGAARAARLRNAVEATRQAEIDRMVRLHPGVDRAALETFSRALTNRLFHGPSQAARTADASFAEQFVELFVSGS